MNAPACASSASTLACHDVRRFSRDEDFAEGSNIASVTVVVRACCNESHSKPDDPARNAAPRRLARSLSCMRRTGMPLTLGHYSREDIPFYYSLADAFELALEWARVQPTA